MSIIVRSGDGTNLLSVDANHNALVNMPLVAADAGFVTVAGEVDAGTVTGTRLVRNIELNEDYALRVGHDNIMYAESFMGTAINTGQWFQSLGTMTLNQANGFLALNSGASTTSSQYAIVQSYKTFPIIGTQTTYVQWRASINSPAATGKVCDMGLGYVATTASCTDGVFFRYASGGTFQGVVNNNGTEVTATIPASATPADGENHYYCIAVTWQAAEFWIDDTLCCRIASPSGNNQVMRATSAPFFARVANPGTAASAGKINLSHVVIEMGGAPTNRPWAHVMSGLGQHCQNGVTSWGVLGTQNNWANSPTIASAALANTTAYSAALGGIFTIPACAGAVTDYIVFGYQASAGTAAVAGKTLYVTDIRIDSVNAVAAVATTPTTIHWCLGYGSSALTLATTDGAGTKAPRRFPLGMQSWVVGAAIGAQAEPIQMNLVTPIPVYQGQFLHVIAQMIYGTATAGQVIRGVVSIGGYWE